MKHLLAIATLSAALTINPAFAETTVTIVSGQEKQNGEILKQIFSEFDTDNADISIDFQIDNKNDLETAQKVMADIIAGMVPDAVRVTGAVMSTFLNSGRAQPLDECLAGQPELLAQLDAGLLDNFRGLDGKLYAIPFYTTLPSLYINSTAFRAVGLDPANPPKTWSELESAAKALSDADNGKFGVLMYMPNTYLFEAQMESAGGSWIAEDGKAALAGTAAEETFAYMRSLVENGYMPAIAPSAFWGEFASLFRSGDLGMMVWPTSNYPSLTGGLDFETTIAPMPFKDGGSIVANASANGFVMLATDPDQQQATCLALSSLVSAENVTSIVKATATVPHNVNAVANADMLGNYYKENPEYMAINSQASGNWYSMPGRSNSEFHSIFGEIQFQVLSGDLTPADAATKLSDRINELLEDN